MKTILVTGGSGFIGGHFIDQLYNRFMMGYRIVNFDALTYAACEYRHEDKHKKENTHNEYAFVKGDVTSEGDLDALFSYYNFDYIIHFAAESHVDRSIEDSSDFLKTNILGTQCLMDKAKEQWQIGNDSKGYPKYKRDVKFIYISTDEVYGELKDNQLFNEDSPLNPSNPYAVSKAGADMLARSYFRTYHFPVIITRSSNNYGIYQYPEKLIPVMVKKALNNEMLPVYGDGKQSRDWMYVKDHCVVLETLLYKGKIGEVYNISCHNDMTNIQMAKSILSIMGKDESLIHYVPDRLGHDFKYGVDTEKLENTIKSFDKIDFKTGLENTVTWYIDYFKE